MAGAYYAFIAGFPDFELDGGKLPVTLAEARAAAFAVLDPADEPFLRLFFAERDNANVLTLLEKRARPFDTLGNFSRDELEEELRYPSRLPAWTVAFLGEYREGTLRGTPDNRLAELFLAEAAAHPAAFANAWFTFERDLRTVLAGAACRRHGLAAELEVPGEDDVAETARKSRAPDFGLARALPWLETALAALDAPDLLDRELALDRLRWDMVDRLTVFEYFSAASVAGRLLQLGLAERWRRLDAGEGRGALDGLRAALSAGVSFTGHDFSARS